MTKLPIKIAKLISGGCLYSGCSDSAIKDGDYCAPHDARERARKKKKDRRRRQKLADAGLCIVSGCGRKVGKRRRLDGTIQQRRCGKCSTKKIAAERLARQKRGAPGADSGAPGTAAKGEWRVETGTHAWGSGTYQTERWHSGRKKGRMTREEQLDELKRTVRFAREELVKLDRAIDQLKLPEVMELPPIQRRAAWREASMFAGSAERHCEECRETLEGEE